MDITVDDFKNLLFEVYLLRRELAEMQEALKKATADKGGKDE